MKERKFILYKVYGENCLLYLGRTKQQLQNRLHQHFFKAPMVRAINIDSVTRIEYTELETEADLYLYEVYYINLLKPVLNRDDKANDRLTISLPPLFFQEYDCKLMNKWKENIHLSDRKDKEKRNLERQLETERREKKYEIYSRKDLTSEEKQELYSAWLEEYYEPVKNGIF